MSEAKEKYYIELKCMDFAGLLETTEAIRDYVAELKQRIEELEDNNQLLIDLNETLEECLRDAESRCDIWVASNKILLKQKAEMLELLSELYESAEYWCEYDVPIGIVDRIKNQLIKHGVIK